MRDAPWIEAAEKYGCEYVHDFVWGKRNEDDDIYHEGDDEDVRDEDSDEED